MPGTDKQVYKGYSGEALAKLKEIGIRVWSDVIMETEQGRFEGIILPRSETADCMHVVIKLKNGYNIGIRAVKILSAREVDYKEALYKIPESEFPWDASKPNVTLLGTGGTIASRLDYRTGAVIPAFTPGELYGAVPELADICNMKTKKLFGVFSENMGPEEWIVTAKAIGKEIENGADGIIVGHGTDTMHHTSAVLSFMVRNSPIPIVMVGSQRSSDRPSSDAALNLQYAAFAAAHGDIAETMICMFGPTSDQYGLLHPGTRVRKMHSSYRSTFRTIGDIPLARVTTSEITPLTDNYQKRRSDRNVTIDAVFDPRVTIVYYYPNMQPDIIDSLVENGYKGIVIAGTGLGHVNKPLYPALKRAHEAGVAIFMTVQTLWGYVQMFVYETGREMLKLGVVPCANMLPETAYVKLGWALAHSSDIEEIGKIMLAPVSRDITEREPYNGYLIYQGGLPEIEEFLKKIKR
ncbi:Glu-tRNA(Gln) amidotransferase subunit GatD [bacterium]|nr:Glu-tRNA(Gln) amidotransferase subunit GatD [bacterium]